MCSIISTKVHDVQHNIGGDHHTTVLKLCTVPNSLEQSGIRFLRSLEVGTTALIASWLVFVGCIGVKIQAKFLSKASID